MRHENWTNSTSVKTLSAGFEYLQGRFAAEKVNTMEHCGFHSPGYHEKYDHLMAHKVVSQRGLTRRYSPYLMAMLALLKDGSNIFSTKHGEQFIRNIIRKPLEERVVLVVHGNPEKLSFLLSKEFVASISVDGNTLLFQDKIMRARAAIYEALRDLEKNNMSQIVKDLLLSFEILGFNTLNEKARRIADLI